VVVRRLRRFSQIEIQKNKQKDSESNEGLVWSSLLVFLRYLRFLLFKKTERRADPESPLVLFVSLVVPLFPLDPVGDQPGSRSLTVSRSLWSSAMVASIFPWANSLCSMPWTMLHLLPSVVSGKLLMMPSSTP
jgi:hypothetical protein